MGWPLGTLSVRQPRGEIRALTTLVDITFYATADVGSIPTVSMKQDEEGPAPAGPSALRPALEPS